MTRESNKNRLTLFFSQEYVKLRNFIAKYLADAADRDVDDFLHDFILHFWDKADLTAPVENLSAYIYRAIRNKIIDSYKKRKIKKISLEQKLEVNGTFSLKDILKDHSYHPEKITELKELREKLSDLICGLKPKEREVIIATELDGIPFKELSLRWNMPIGTLLAKKSRALIKIRRQLEKENYYRGPD